MIIALKKALAKQKRREPFGPVDIKSLYPLIERGLVRYTFYKTKGKEKPTWYVTKKGLRILYSFKKNRN